VALDVSAGAVAAGVDAGVCGAGVGCAVGFAGWVAGGTAGGWEPGAGASTGFEQADRPTESVRAHSKLVRILIFPLEEPEVASLTPEARLFISTS
jgi:hypothetical protein